MIILAGETAYQDKVIERLQWLGYVKEDLAVSIHSRAHGTASRGDLQTWMTEKPKVEVDIERAFDGSRTSYAEWVARLKSREEETGGRWFIHDFRVFWFWDQFTAFYGEVKVITIDSDAEDSYSQALSRFLADKAPKDGLKLTKFDLNAIDAFVNQSPVKAKKEVDK